MPRRCPYGPRRDGPARWPTDAFGDRVWFDVDGVADDLLLYVGDRPVRAASDPIDSPTESDTAVLVGLGPDGVDTGGVVGIHVHPLLAGAARHRLHWRRLAEPHPPAELVAAFVAEVRELFERYWTPAPTME
ncbi:MAG TPA: hypothetical protein VER37_10465, partial [Thermomicrobiales bacterium]|nr:hypothetical protein [Thermomicrobiales bacterium]